MTVEITNKNETLTAIDAAVNELTSLMASVDDDKINTVPYEGSWTAPQLLIHVSKSMSGMADAMQQNGKPANRDPAQRIQELKTVFLDFSKKLQTPEFINPEVGVYERQPMIEKLNNAFKRFKESAAPADLNTVVEGLPFGSVTKLEMLHFVLYHTQRHVHQMNKICEALKNN